MVKALPVLVNRGWLDIGVSFALLAVVLITLLGFFKECPGLLWSHFLVLILLLRFLVCLWLLLRLLLWLLVLRWLFLFWLIFLLLVLLLLLLVLFLLILLLILLLVLLLLLVLVLVFVFRQELFNFYQEIVGSTLAGQGCGEIGGFDLPERLALQRQGLLGQFENIRTCLRRDLLFRLRRVG